MFRTEIRRIARLRISLISGMPQTHNENIQPADRSEENLTVSRIFLCVNGGALL